MQTRETITEALLRRDHWIVCLGIAVILLISWWYLFTGAGTGMSVWAMTTLSFPPPAHPAMPMNWGAGYWITMFTMWWVMMIAMMIPSAATMVLLYARVSRHAQYKGRMPVGSVPTALFLAGYLAIWLGFSVVATIFQWGFERLGLLHGSFMWSISHALSGVLLIVAGVYQLSSLKHVCLEHCRSPAEYLSQHWRPGKFGAFRMGSEHGVYCLGCCWMLMALLFVGGAMNLVWIAGLSILVLIEKSAPCGHRLAQGFGAAMIGAGVWILLIYYSGSISA